MQIYNRKFKLLIATLFVSVVLSGCGLMKSTWNKFDAWGDNMPVSDGTSACEGRMFCFGDDKGKRPPVKVTSPPIQNPYGAVPSVPNQYGVAPQGYGNPAPNPYGNAAPIPLPPAYGQPPMQQYGRGSPSQYGTVPPPTLPTTPKNQFEMPAGSPTFASHPVKFDKDGKPILPNLKKNSGNAPPSAYGQPPVQQYGRGAPAQYGVQQPVPAEQQTFRNNPIQFDAEGRIIENRQAAQRAPQYPPEQQMKPHEENPPWMQNQEGWAPLDDLKKDLDW